MNASGAVLPWRGWRLALTLLLAGAVSAAGFPPVFALPLLSLGLLFLYRCAEDAATWRYAALYGFLFGLGFNTAGLYWLTDAILTRVHDFWWAIPIAAPGCALILAPFVALPAAACRLAPAGWRRVLLFAGLWTLADMGRVFLFTGFPWNPPGSVLEWPGRIGDWLIQPAAWIGVDGLTLAIMLACLLVWQGRRWALAVCLCAGLWLGLGAWRHASVRPLPVRNPVVALTQGNVSEGDILTQADAVSAFRRYLRLTATGVAQARALPDAAGRSVVYVWPESGFPGFLNADELARRMIARAGDGAVGVVGSDRDDGQGHYFNSAFALSPDGTILDAYDKSTLVPFGEYAPRFVPVKLVPGVLTPGPGLKTWNFPGFEGLGPMVCYEVIFSGHVVGQTRPNWLLNITNDAWFGDSAGPRQHLATARMRAVEEGLPVVQDANTGITAIYDATGMLTARLPWGREGVLTAVVPSPLPPTFFSRHGRATPFLLGLFCIVLAWPSLIRRRL
ncbi:apolipoprotein N-acyltransferase [Neoasaia chiangmaiensis NBRC 101099]|uniref:Apolipoprotein N-acyltransferase n=1 Tax=Neoasaia chiangmaiensis TaxID=320497 RepID=A0A1U9KPZ5_9PROT|nr:apolipoprotein N-acyltransferase [Neoasaia chiangmaiensis]AQS87845.1 apolipoprotein N-acyltransferase [Neoasaia chiangmaiensis]GBR35886.1 apolipoprotein N-acyltransferase [Neoasaia chiangmaiensis NBRC 101099]GEN14464.1 apolipoprotein N-acyltransferase [Neoasaia chiangmaiensis]